MSYQPIIGLEVHVELATQSKMFCGCPAKHFGVLPNSQTCPVCLGLPGALPVPNKKAVEWTIMLGLALGCKIPLSSKFDRKNYFYPDLPKGYQISQYDQPLCRGGVVEIDLPVMLNSFQHPEVEGTTGGIPKPTSSAGRQVRDDKILQKKRIRIHRVHLEEDTGKLLHATVNGEKVTLIDFNRSGVTLVEIVTEPDINSAEEAKIFLKKLHQIVRYLGISDADMEKGSMRLEPNISVRQISNLKSLPRRQAGQISKKEELPPYKVEVKNINSFNFVRKAIDYEVARQVDILESGETPVQETRGWEEKKGVTLPQRRKEEANDYRYFPEPDIPPMRWDKNLIRQLADQIPEMPDKKLFRFTHDYLLPVQDAQRLTEMREMAEYFEESVKRKAVSVKYKDITPIMIANWLINKNVDISKVTPERLLNTILRARSSVVVDEAELRQVVEKVILENPKAVGDYKSGKQGSIMYMVGMTMRKLNGKGNTQVIRNLLEKNLQ